jgi:Glycine-zipper domain
MNRPAFAALLGGFLPAGCAVRPPTGPTVLAIPPEGKNLAQFQQEEANCRNFAFNQIGISPAQGANQSAVGSAAVGTVLGTAAGALLGAAGGAAGTGAAIGAGTGLLAGSAVGANNAQTSGYALQARYDQAYTQCLASTGNRVQTAAAYASPYGAPYGYSPYYRPYYGPYYSPYYGGYYGPGFWGPGVGLGLGFGIGSYGRFGGHGFGSRNYRVGGQYFSPLRGWSPPGGRR